MKARGAAWLAAMAVSAAVTIPGGAFAAHGTVGLWLQSSRVTSHSDLNLAPGDKMPMPPKVFAAVALRCMPAAEVASNAPPPPNTKECTYANVKLVGSTFTGQQICHGPDFDGRGHFSMTFDSATHWSGTTSMSGMWHMPDTLGRRLFSMTYETAAKWVQTDCLGHRSTPVN